MIILPYFFRLCDAVENAANLRLREVAENAEMENVGAQKYGKFRITQCSETELITVNTGNRCNYSVASVSRPVARKLCVRHRLRVRYEKHNNKKQQGDDICTEGLGDHTWA